jgi:hypothetical protein
MQIIAKPAARKYIFEEWEKAYLEHLCFTRIAIEQMENGMSTVDFRDSFFSDIAAVGFKAGYNFAYEEMRISGEVL